MLNLFALMRCPKCGHEELMKVGIASHPETGPYLCVGQYCPQCWDGESDPQLEDSPSMELVVPFQED